LKDNERIPLFFKVLSQDTEEDHHTKFKSTDISAEIHTWYF